MAGQAPGAHPLALGNHPTLAGIVAPIQSGATLVLRTSHTHRVQTRYVGRPILWPVPSATSVFALAVPSELSGF